MIYTYLVQGKVNLFLKSPYSLFLWWGLFYILFKLFDWQLVFNSRCYLSASLLTCLYYIKCLLDCQVFFYFYFCFACFSKVFTWLAYIISLLFYNVKYLFDFFKHIIYNVIIDKKEYIHIKIVAKWGRNICINI